MKRIVVLLLLAVFGVSAVGYGVSHSAAHRHRSEAARFPPPGPLVLGAATRTIFAGANRVETFRLADFHEGKKRTPAEDETLSGGCLGTLDDHVVLRAGVPQGKAFAGRLGTALSKLRGPSSMAMCLDSGVGFRVWKGKAHTDLCVCFYCSGVEIITKDARHKEVFRTQTELGGSRAAFLALARQAFPQDAPLAALKS